MTPDAVPGKLKDALRGTFLIAKKEYTDKVRNRWILVLSFLLLLASLTIAYLGGTQAGGDLGFRDFRATVPFLGPIAVYLVPLVAIIMGYGTIAGEDESGSLQLVLSLPVTRNQVLFGKFLGLGGVLATTVLVGLGVTGIVVAAAAGTAYGDGYLVLLGVSLLIGLVFLSLSLLLSSLARRRSTAIGGAVFLFFYFLVLFDLIVFGVLAATGWTLDLLHPSAVTFPDWTWVALLASPMECSSMAAFMAVGVTEVMGYGVVPPPFFTGWLIGGVLVVWVLVPLALAWLAFRRRDL